MSHLDNEVPSRSAIWNTHFERADQHSGLEIARQRSVDLRPSATVAVTLDSLTPERWFWITFRARATEGHRRRYHERRVGDVLLQDQWFHQVNSSVIENDVAEDELTAVQARMAVQRAACPACGTLSAHLHSRYIRRLTDTAVSGRPAPSQQGRRAANDQR